MTQKVKIFEATKQAGADAQQALAALRRAQNAAVEQYQAASRLEKILLQRAQQELDNIQRAQAQAQLAEELARAAQELPDIVTDEVAPVEAPPAAQGGKKAAAMAPPAEVAADQPIPETVEEPALKPSRSRKKAPEATGAPVAGPETAADVPATAASETPTPATASETKTSAEGAPETASPAVVSAAPAAAASGASAAASLGGSSTSGTPTTATAPGQSISAPPPAAPVMPTAFGQGGTAQGTATQGTAAQLPITPRPAPKPGTPVTSSGLKPGDRVAAPPRPDIKPAGVQKVLRPEPPRPLRPGDRVAAAPRPDIRPAGVQRPLRPNEGRPASGGFDNRPRPGGAPQQGQGPRPGGGAPGAGGFRRPAPKTDTVASPLSDKERVSNYDPNRSTYQRNHESDRREKNKRDLFRAHVAQTGDSDDGRWGRGRRRGPQKARAAAIVIESAVITTEMVPVKDLAEKIGKPAAAIIKKLFALGQMVTINQEIDFDTAAIVAAEYDVELTQKLDKTFEEQLFEVEDFVDEDDNRGTRPPVVTVMGHVDHGKTSILDAVRRANVASGEAGGITQHIGAYQVELDGQPITFLDTPGHEAFTAMRARGAQVTDIAVLVVAADDGIMPQTVEAINHAKSAKVPIIVAINKIDRPNADVNRVMQMLTEHELLAEDWGGDTVVCPVSAITGEGIPHLLEMILLVADVQDLRANANRRAKGTIIEAQLDRGRGPVATVLVQNGTLRVGDTVVAGTAYGRVRAMMNDKGERVNEALPAMPVEVLGFSEVPAAGDILFAVEEDKFSRQVAEERRDKMRATQMASQSRASLDDLFARISEGEVKDLNLIIKADVQGSVEAVCQAMTKLSNEQVRVAIVHAGVGAIREQDVMLAMTSNAIIIGFNVRPEASARAEADRENVDMRLYRIIYQAIEDIEKAMKGLLAPVFRETVLGHAQVRNVFKVTGVGTIAGCYVADGKVARSAQLRLLRDLIVIHEGQVASLKRFKEDAREVASGYECGIGIEGYNDIKEGDVIEAFVVEEIKQD